MGQARNANTKTISGVSDLPLARWREYDELFTDSLWMLGDRDKSGQHDGSYHGNFVPQIPNQLIRRYTAAGGVVLDAFLGSGTTMIEARRLGRNCVGVELLPEMANSARRAAAKQTVELRRKGRTPEVFSSVLVGDSSNGKMRNKVAASLSKHGREHLDLIILHPPYHDIIQFSERPGDLSNAASTDEFAERFGAVIENFAPMLRERHYLAIVIGDKYEDGEWVPLGFRVMQETLQRDPTLSLKSIVVKNMVNNRAKRNKEKLWRYRALAGGFYVFRHEYILLFQKKARR